MDDFELAKLLQQSIQHFQVGQLEAAAELLGEALRLSRRFDNQIIEGVALTILGNVYLNQNKYQQAIEAQNQALDLAEETGNYAGRGAALSGLGFAHLKQGQCQVAIAYLDEALSIFERVNDDASECQALSGLGNAYAQLERYSTSISYYHQALSAAEESDNPTAKATAWSGLGEVYLKQGQYQKAIDLLKPVVPIFREMGNRQWEGEICLTLGTCYNNLRQYDEVIISYEQALTNFQEIGKKDRVANLLLDLGVAHEQLGHYTKATSSYNEALLVFGEIGDRQGEGKALLNLGINCLYLAQYSNGKSLLLQALSIFQDLGDLERQGLTLERLGYVHNGLGQFPEAIKYIQQGLEVTKNGHNRLLEGMILNNLGNALTQAGQPQEAVEHLNKALAIAQELGDSTIQGQALTFLGIISLDQKDYQKAIEIQTEALSSLRRTNNYLGQGSALGCLGLVYFQQNQYEKGIEHFKEALSNFAQIGYRIGEYQVLNGLGYSYTQLKEYSNAIDSFQQALSIAQVISYSTGEVITIVGLGDAYVQLGQVQNEESQKKQQYQKAIDILQPLLVTLPQLNDLSLKVTTYSNLGKAYAGLKQVSEAIQFFESGLEVVRDIGDHIEEIVILSSLSSLYFEVKNFEGIIEKTRQFLSNLEETNNSKNNLPSDISLNLLAEAQYNLGTAYIFRVQGDRANNLETAISYLKEALRVFNKKDFPEEWANTQTNLANVYLYRIQGGRSENIENSINHSEATLTVHTKEYNSYEWAKTQLNLSHAYMLRVRGNQIDNIEKSFNYSENALIVLTLETYPIEWAKVQSNLGCTYGTYANAPVIRASKEVRVDNLRESLQHFNLALEVLTRDNEPFEWLQVQINLTRMLTDLANTINEPKEKKSLLEESINSCQLALQICNYEASPEQWAEIKTSLAVAYMRRELGHRTEKLEQSIACFQDALQVYTRDAYPRKYTEAQYNLGRVYTYANQFENAYQAFHSAIETAEKLRGKITLSSGTIEDKRKLAEAWGQLYPSMVEVCLELNKPIEALEYIERSKNQSLIELLSSQSYSPKKEAYNNKNIYQEHCQKLEVLRQEIIVVQHRLEILRDRSSLSYQKTSKDLQEKTSALNILLEAIKQYDQSFNLTQQVNKISFSKIQSLINDQTAIIEWYLSEKSAFAFIITTHTSEPVVWRSSSEDWTDFMLLIFLDYWISFIVSSDKEYEEIFTNIIKKVIQENPESYKENLNRMNEFEDRIRQWNQNLDQKLERTSQILHLDELLDRLPEECNQLIIVPYRGLHMLPFHALPIAKISDEKTLMKPRLLDRFKLGVRYAPSCQLLQLAQAQQRSSFNKIVTIQEAADDLPFSDIETESIHALFPAREGNNNNHDLQDLTNTHCIHFACHGSFNQNEPLKSYLSRDPRNQQKEITLAEIFELSLNHCRLVALSACETGLTEPLSSSDEYITLASGFLYAGSSSVVSSLWQVDDLSTSLLMIKFYQNLYQAQAKNVSLALNQAQLWLQDANVEELKEWAAQLCLTPTQEEFISDYLEDLDSNTKPFQSPYYWAAFCAVGQ